MKSVHLLAATACIAFPALSLAQEKLTRPANLDKPEIVKPLPRDVKSLRSDSGPGMVKEKLDKPVVNKNSNPGQGPKEKYDKPKRVNTKGSQPEEEIYVGVKRTSGDATSGPADKMRGKPKVTSKKNTRGSSDEGGDIEDLEIQR